MKKFAVYLKGILLGFVGLAIPGLSASTIALEVGIYYEMIDAISGILSDFKKNVLYLIILILGYLSGGFIGSVAVDTVYVHFPLVMVLLITGFVLGGIPNQCKKLKDGLKKPSCYIVAVVVVLLLLSFSFFVTSGEPVSFDNMEIADYIILFFVGVFTSSTLVVPGVDFAVLFLAIGYYQAFTGLIAHIYEIDGLLKNLSILLVYAVGYGVGSFLFSKIIKKLVGAFRMQTEFASFAFIAVAPVIIVKKNVIDGLNAGTFFTSVPQWIVGSVSFVLGFIAMFFLLKKFSDKEKQLLDKMQSESKNQKGGEKEKNNEQICVDDSV